MINHKEKSWLGFMPGFVTAGAGSDSLLLWLGLCTASVMLGIFAVTVPSLPSSIAPLVLVAILCPFLVILIGEVRKLLLALVLLDIPLQLDFNFAHRDEIAQFGTLGGLNLSVTTFALVVLYTMWLVELLVMRKDLQRVTLRYSKPFVWYVLFVICSAFVAYDAILSSFEIFVLLQLLLLQVYIACTVRSSSDIMFIVTFLLLGLVLESAITLQAWVTGQSFTVAGISAGAHIDASIDAQVTRATGTMGSANYVAAYFSFALSLAVSVLFTRLGIVYKGLAILAIGLGGVALIATFSRGGWIALSISLIILGGVAWRRGWLSLTAPIAVLAIGLLLALFFQDAIVTRIISDDGGSAHSRVPLMELAIRMIEDRPLLGVGSNNFATVMEQYLTADIQGAWLYTVHNNYFLVWSETGTLGLLMYLWLLVATLRRGWRCGHSDDPLLAPIAAGLTAAIGGHMVQLSVDPFNARPLRQLLWLSAGLICALYVMTNKGEDPQARLQ